eukprot:TRINITY_DN15805_c0_g2_i2.p1 TRINITY_DN15805_c0_g2~~TRINITY_DN15805_c0_g2_i2.p1  ORF type:complete len:341 (-),score=45.24 TRINITY_DN15805_c0_g2_i2:495-1517(-)
MTNNSRNQVENQITGADNLVPNESHHNFAINEEKVENAVAFLLHPKVVGSPDNQKLIFLQRKGLNQAEIQEAFRRCELRVNQGQDSLAISSASLYNQHNYSLWARSAQIAIGVGLVAGLAFALKQWVSPMLRKWVDQWSGKAQVHSQEEQVVTEMKKATEAMQSVATDLKTHLQHLSQVMVTQHSQVLQMKEEMRGSPGGALSAEQIYRNKGSYRDSFDHRNGSYSPHQSGGARSSTPEQPPYPSTYNDLVAEVQRGSKPANVKNVDDKPPNPNQKLTPSMLQRPVKPWDKASSSERGSAIYMGRSSASPLTPRSESKLHYEGGLTEVDSVQRTDSSNIQ